MCEKASEDPLCAWEDVLIITCVLGGFSEPHNCVRAEDLRGSVSSQPQLHVAMIDDRRGSSFVCEGRHNVIQYLSLFTAMVCFALMPPQQDRRDQRHQARSRNGCERCLGAQQRVGQVVQRRRGRLPQFNNPSNCSFVKQPPLQRTPSPTLCQHKHGWRLPMMLGDRRQRR